MIWKTRKLGDIFQIKPPKSETNRLGDTAHISFVPMEDLGILSTMFTAKKEKQLKEVIGKYTYFADNDVLLAKITPCFENGKMGIARNLKNGVGFGSSEFIVFRSNGQVIPEYLFYILCTTNFREQGKKRMSGAVGHKRVQKEFIENYLIQFPESISEQQHIVAILDKTFSAIVCAKENAEKNIKNSQILFKNYLGGVFKNKDNGWQTRKLGEICEMINRGISPKYTTTDGVCVLNQKCIRDHKINFELSRLHDFGSKKVSDDKFIQIGDVLINSTGTGTLGRVAQVKELPFNATVDSHVTIVRPIKNMFYNDFFGYSLIFIEDEISKRGDGCGGQTELARNTLKHDFEITYPKSLAEQQRIASQLDFLSAETNKLETIYQAKINELEILKESILQKAFSGKFTTENIDIDSQVQA
jgi:type I restriction enzyme S subunit